MISPGENNVSSRSYYASGAFRLKFVLSFVLIILIISRSFSVQIKDALDATGLTLLALVIVPWLGPIFETIKVAGVEAKFRDIDRQLRVVEATAQEAKGMSADAGQKANLAVSSNLTPRMDRQISAAEDEIGAMAREYKNIRDSLPPGPIRTQRMTDVVSDMIKYFKNNPDISVDNYIVSEKIGERLAAYAYYMANTGAAPIERLLRAIDQEKAPFNQYWGLQAIARLTSVPESRTKIKNMEADLVRMREKFPLGTDRREVIDQILSSIFDF